MKLESQVCSLDLAKCLKELGVKQQSLFVWMQKINSMEYAVYPSSPFFPEEGWRFPTAHKDGDAAYTVAELGEMMPKIIIHDGIGYYYTQIQSKYLDKWIIFYRNYFSSWNGKDQEDEKEVDARAKMLIYLLENNLVSVEEINQRIAA